MGIQRRCVMQKVHIKPDLYFRLNWDVQTDLAGWLKCMGDFTQSQHLPENVLPDPYTEDSAKKDILKNQNFIESQGASTIFSVNKINLPIIYKETQLIGAILIRPFKNSFESVEIGYVLDSDFQGKGIMTESVRKFIYYVFDKFENLTELTAIISDEH